MDAFYILQASLMTKYMTEPTNPYILVVFFHLCGIQGHADLYNRTYKRHNRILFDK